MPGRAEYRSLRHTEETGVVTPLKWWTRARWVMWQKAAGTDSHGGMGWIRIHRVTRDRFTLASAGNARRAKSEGRSPGSPFATTQKGSERSRGRGRRWGRMRDRGCASPALRMARLPCSFLRVHEIPDGAHRLSRGPGNGEFPEIDANIDATASAGKHQRDLSLGQRLRVG